METIITQPSATPVIQALRSLGYSTNTAIADLIDNSIDAKSAKIEINFNYNQGNGNIQVIDNGCGMDENTIQAAMSIGSKNPRDERGREELGRFGMGLKTASFSLGKRLSVMSKIGDRVVERCWDLDYIAKTNEWSLFTQIPDEVRKNMKEINGESGTIVVIDKLDRFMRAGTEQPIQLKSFLEKVRRVKNHLSFVYHSLLEKNKFTLSLNEQLIYHWDPFLKDNDYTIKYRTQRLKQDNINFYVTAFVLPHSSHLNQIEFKSAGGPKGWRDQQGFYIYRENRLLYSGDWLGLFPKDAPSQLARIRIDIPNIADDSWQVDIKKSSVTPPDGLAKDRLRAIAKQVRAQSKEIFYFRTSSSGKHPALKGNVNPWYHTGKEEGPEFALNYSHPILTEILNNIDDKNGKLLNTYLKLVQLGSPANVIQVTKVSEGDIQYVKDSEKESIIQLAWTFNQVTNVVAVDQMTDILSMQPSMDKFNRETIVHILEGNINKWTIKS